MQKQKQRKTILKSNLTIRQKDTLLNYKLTGIVSTNINFFVFMKYNDE
jgi:hypothetical protein